MFEWDEAKRGANLAKHGVDFADAEGLDWDTAVIIPDHRFDYGEDRFRVSGMIGDRLYMAVITPRPDRVRIISLRKANRKEIEAWHGRIR